MNKTELSQNQDAPRTAMVLDLETLATTPRAVVLQIGYAIVDLERLTIKTVRGVSLAITDQMLYRGREVDPETLRWWNSQPEFVKDSVRSNGYARRIIAEDPKTEVAGFVMEPAPVDADPREACRELRAAFGHFNCSELWAGPSHFDVPITQSLFFDYAVEVPWTHQQVRCLRTLRKVLDIERRGSEIQHDAVADAEAAAYELIACLKDLRGESARAQGPSTK